MTTPFATAPYSFDASGNVTGDGVHLYQYDAENRLVKVDGGATAEYWYDSANRRVKKLVAGVTTTCVWDGARLIGEITPSGKTSYVYFGNKLIARILPSGAKQYLLQDLLGVRGIMDEAGNVLGAQWDLPFGEDLLAAGEQEKHRFTSYDREADTGLDYAINRWYSPALGRFLSADPYRPSGGPPAPQSWNRYAYSRNDPVNRVDPFGREDGPVNGGDLGTVTVTANANGGTISAAGASMIGIVGRSVVEPVLDGDTSDGDPQTPTSNPRQDFKNFLKTMSQDCKDALKKIGVLGKVTQLANTARIYDVNKLQNARASTYVDGLAKGRETLGQWFDRTTPSGGAKTIVGGASHVGIYIRGGESAFAGNLYFELHEFTHLAFPRGTDLDASLANALHLTKGATETWSDAVSRFFNSQCTKKTP